MADNFTVKDAGGSTITIRAKDDGTGKYVGQSVASDASGNVLIGQKIKTGSLPVVLASDQDALPITDNGGSLTVDGTVAATQSGTWNVGTVTTVTAVTGITNVVHVDDNAGSLTVDGTVGVSGTVAVTDNSGSLTVDAPVGTPVFVRLSDGTSAITNLSANVTQLAGTAVAVNSGTNSAGTQRVTLATDDSLVAVMVAGTITSKVTYTRPADTTAYAVDDYSSNSTSSPTTGGLTFTMARASGKGGILTDVIITSSNNAATTLQGELWLFDQAPTAGNDNVTWALSDADVLNLVAVIPFSLIKEANNSWAHIQNLNIGYTCVGSTNLRGLVKVKNTYTPASSEVIGITLKGVQTN